MGSGRQSVDNKKERVQELHRELEKQNQEHGYFFNPDREFVEELMDGLLRNQDRYGYLFCPCRLATGDKKQDMDLICPCDYRDDDLSEYGTCYCALYVDSEIAEGKKQPHSIPERRNQTEKEGSLTSEISGALSFPVWRCKVCGYLAARGKPPGVCPICGVDKERFERFL